ncbi:Uncharacterised protein [Mycobacterium tuberculosis]|uniref:Uncharacterized protein n=1 Tax=Mycobacterium tuberculosis TaxID=1773 RepID=A0A0U0S8L2_MYCTX|nr:Uncharacterised protein [Mycobacterium tuberculosis]
MVRRGRGTRHRLSHPPHRCSGSRWAARTRGARRTADVLQTGPFPAAVGTVGHRGRRGRPHRHADQDASRHRRRCLRCRAGRNPVGHHTRTTTTATGNGRLRGIPDSGPGTPGDRCADQRGHHDALPHRQAAGANRASTDRGIGCGRQTGAILRSAQDAVQCAGVAAPAGYRHTRRAG